MGSDVRVCADLDELSLGAAEAAVRAIDEAVRARGRCALVLSGGSTPRPLYGLLASRFRDAIPWARVHVFWADERYVPADHPDSNVRMAKDALLNHVPCPAEQIHPMPTRFPDPADAARDYEESLRRSFAGEGAGADLVVLGLGSDGHTASLFPRSPALRERTRLVVATRAPAGPRWRLTLTLPALNRAAHVCFLVAGSAKAEALRQTLRPDADANSWPASGVRPERGTPIWWVDREAWGDRARG
jgi:6-phosphogluconolactonase